ncbi:glycosyltransferase involved in cell wall biosynthesis [Microbacterium sp. W4I4]|uniref:glycosyltransferase n=1 Tax=Microbacterium sp. W4I4 TaxID=3042295 RepID=UPI0027881C61|nr:glycosyltransferase [Microbacterium sp. W4I4]MDQ0613761.1 glycosyltransferase involved in cell wall biosynthesis [Microbacterium sp. W4I4]
MHIVQIASRVGPGTGIGAVAWNLEREFLAQGHTVERFTMTPKAARTRLGHQLRQAWSTVHLTFTGTRRARRFLAERADAVAISHNAVMAGDLYVDHGLAIAAVSARGRTPLRVLRNPAIGFGWVRDSIRFRNGTHRMIIAPTTAEAGVLRRVHRGIRTPIEVIPHGVDLETFRPPTPDERSSARAALALDDEHRVALFVGHELRWKGVPQLIDALVHATTVMLLVVGGDTKTIPEMRQRAQQRGVAERVLFAGMHADVRPFYFAADMFVLPSGYESFALVIAEALASGLPVIATRTGCAPDLIVEGETGYLVDRDPVMIADRLERIAATDVEEWRVRCRETVAGLAWPIVAAQYLSVLRGLAVTR